MKLQWLFLLLGTAFLYSANGQNYIYNESVGAPDEFNFTNRQSNLILGQENDVLSFWQTLPFPFQFYGQEMTGYFATDNGYITFDRNASISDPMNTSLPNIDGPKNAIFAFWDDMRTDSYGEQVRAYTYGDAPFRIHVIQWYNVSTSTNGSLYCAIILHECGDFEIIHSYGFRNDGTSGTIGCQNEDGTAGSQTTESPNFPFGTLQLDKKDDRVYSFSWDANDYDLGIVSLDLQKYALIGENEVSGTVRNFGKEAITSFDINYTVDGGAPVSASITGVNIEPYIGTYNFSIPYLWTVEDGGKFMDLCLNIDNINQGVEDLRKCNDQYCQELFTITGASGDKSILIEASTGAWCGFCPDGTVVMEQMIDKYPDNVHGVSVHNRDSLTFDHDILSFFKVNSYPTGLLNRIRFPGNTTVPQGRRDWPDRIDNLIGSYTPADVKMSHNYDAENREIDITLTTDMADYAGGDLRFVVMILEDSIVGVGTGYDQVNYFSKDGNAAGGPNHPYYNYPTPIVGYPHNHVLRALPAGPFGAQGNIPGILNPGESYSENFNFQIPDHMNPNHISIIGFLASYGPDTKDREIIDVTQSDLSTMVSNDDLTVNVSDVILYPNPSNSNTTVLKFTAQENIHARIDVFDLMGKRISRVTQGRFIGQNQVPIDLSGLGEGIYHVSLVTDAGEAFTRQIIVVK